jgi:hypothetical protein
MRPVGAELFHTNRTTDERTDGQTDRYDEANSQYANASESTLNFYSPTTVIRDYLNKEPK